MAVSRLSITGVRNLQPVTLDLSPRINILHGVNGSGKTSVLEAVYLLALARSFRSSRLQPIIQHEENACTVFGNIQHSDGSEFNVGISRNRQSELQIKINGQNVRSAAQLAQTLPIQLINPDSFRLLEGSPKIRRQFLDWGVFHMEPKFLDAWRRLQTGLKQRNSLLRHATIDPLLLHSWEHELCLASNELDSYRRLYIQQLKPVFEKVLAQLIDVPSLTLSYFRGWDKEKDLQEVLTLSLERDSALGYTQAGPQRADLRLRISKNNAVDILSRGQQKLVVCALRIAQGYLLAKAQRQQCIYLVDDLPSELDQAHRQALCRLLEDLNCQVFITCVDHLLMTEGWGKETPITLFHVKQGQITLSGVTA